VKIGHRGGRQASRSHSVEAILWRTLVAFAVTQVVANGRTVRRRTVVAKTSDFTRARAELQIFYRRELHTKAQGHTR